MARNTNSFYSYQNSPPALILGSEGAEAAAPLISALNHRVLWSRLANLFSKHCRPLPGQHLITEPTAESTAPADMFPDLDAAGSSWGLMPQIALEGFYFFSPLLTPLSLVALGI